MSLYDKVKEDKPWEYIPGDSGHKLYVLVRGDLSKSQQAVQAGHAIAQILLEGKHKDDPEDQPYFGHYWQNGTLVMLKVKDLTDLILWREKIRAKGLMFSEFKESDLNMETTAVATIGDYASELLKQIPLL